MTNRRGVTLVELLIVIVLLAVVGMAVTRVLVGSFRVSRAQMIRADLQSNVRTGALALPMELREMGYDSTMVGGVPVVTGDIEGMGSDWVTFRAMRGMGFVCQFVFGGGGALEEVRIRRPPQGSRLPLPTDGFLLFIEKDFNLAFDDEWVQAAVFSIANSNCGGEPALRLELNAGPKLADGASVAASMVFNGAPIRFYERMRFGAFVDTDGLTYMGARSLSLGEVAYQAAVGPLDPAAGVVLTYLDRNGNVLDPALANPTQVRTIDIRLTGLTRDQINLAGSLPRQTNTMMVRTRVSLRNSLR